MTDFKKQKGAILIYLIIFIAVFTIVMPAVVGNFVAKLRLLSTTIIREQSLQIAEAGINYYQWHLVQFPGDYQDGTGQQGPYVHDYIDYDTQQTIGQFSLVITAPPEGETAVTIQSTGWTNDNPSVKRKVTATYGIPSLANYALLAHDWIYAWSTESYTGPIHSDTGIRFEGTTQSAVTSSVESTYFDDCRQEYPEAECPTRATRDAIWATGPNKSQSLPYWSNPTTKADFTGISSAFSTISQKSSLPGNINLPYNSYGYSLKFIGDGTVEIYKVLRTTNSGAKFPVTTAISNGTNTVLKTLNGGTDYSSGTCTSCSGCYNKGRCLLAGYPKAIPAGGLVIYATNNLWVEGTVKGRVVIATANGASDALSMASIYISNNLMYSDRGLTDSERTDTIGLMAEGNIIITKNAPNTLYVDGALLAQNGFVAFPICYTGGATNDDVYFFGSIILHGSWWFNFTNYCGSSFTDGYLYPHFEWDKNLLYRPPPYFPDSSVLAELALVKWTSD
jgi:hypothetical protein